MRTEAIILRSLMLEESFTRRVLPFIQPEFFLDKNERTIFAKIRAFVEKFNAQPSDEAVILELEQTTGVAQDDLDEMSNFLREIIADKPDNTNEEWLVEHTEKWCQEKAIHNAMLEAISIMEDKKKFTQKGNIPKLLQDALAVCFDPHVGHDYIEDAASRFEFYHKVEQRIPFHLDFFNDITKNGVPRKTLNVCLAGTGVGKSLFMCDLASSYLLKGKNVLYITLEMAEERIAERIDANLMDCPLDELPFMSKEGFDKRMERINNNTNGKLIIKEYPTAQAHVGHFRHLLNELALKKNFKPDAIFIDYLNICASSRVKGGSGSGGMYELVKSIAEELRGLGVEFSVPVWTATQMNRAGFSNNDPDLTNTSESFGLPATADFMFALIADPEFAAMNQLLVKILKNRYGDLSMKNKSTGKSMERFFVGIDRSKMKLYNLDPSAQHGLNNTPPAISPKGNPGQTSSLPGDDTPPWEQSGKNTDDPKFDIDGPTNQSDADMGAEKRRISAMHGSVPYKAAYNTQFKTRKKISG